MVLLLKGAVVACGPEYPWLLTSWSPSAVMVKV